jgi:sulfur-oxidizing protein SoxX
MNTGPRTFSGTRGFAGRAGRRRRTCTSLVLALLGAPLVLVPGCASFPDPQATRGLAEKMVAESYPDMPETLTRRAVQDRAQAICSKVGHAKPTQEEAAEVVQLSRETLKYPASGKLAGDWKAGTRLAYAGQGGRIVQGTVEMAKENGALCSNCHALDPGEVNVGNIGPSLTGYGAQRGNSDAVAKLTYERIYNAWAYSPCSNMPRLGANGHLTPEQIADVVAYLVDPQSPLNRK